MNITAIDTVYPSLGPQPCATEDKEKQAKILRLKKACQQFESLFIYYMLRTMRSASVKSSLLGEGLGSDIFMQMFDEGLAEKMAESGPFGIGDQLYKNYLDYVDSENDKTPSNQLADLAVHSLNIKTKTTTPQIASADIKLDRLDSVINEAAKVNGIDPKLIKAVIIQESGGDPKAVSSKGAKGLMQLMDGTAKMLGVTDPFDIRQNIFGGAKYLASLLKKFDGNLKNALAAYNAGPSSVTKHAGVPPYDETKKYINSIINILGGLF
jgi:Rod binding domain-containing protein